MISPGKKGVSERLGHQPENTQLVRGGMGFEPGELDRAEWPLPSTLPGCHRHRHSGFLLPTAILPSTLGCDQASSPLPLTSLPPGVCPVHLLPAHPVFPASPCSDGDSPPPGSCSLGTGIKSCSFSRKKEKKKMMSEASPSPASSLTVVSFAILTPSQIQTLPIFIYLTVLGLSYGIRDLLAVACGISFPDQGSNLGDFRWEVGFLATHWTIMEVPSLLSSRHPDLSSNVTSSDILTTPPEVVALSPLPALNQHPVGLQLVPKLPT